MLFQDVIFYNIVKVLKKVFGIFLKYGLYEYHIKDSSCGDGKQHLSFPKVKKYHCNKGNCFGNAVAFANDVYAL